MIVRLFANGDEADVRSVLLSAFPSSAEAELVDQLRSDGNAEIELVAEEEGQIVGHILFSDLKAPFRAVALAPVSVTPPHQGCRIGTALIHRGHEIARASGQQVSFVLGDPAYYGRFGYSVDAAKPFQSAYSGPHFMMLVLNGPLPVTHGDLRYPPAFEELD